MNDIEKLKIILKQNGMSGQDLASLLGIRYASYRTMTGNSAKSVPKWASAFVLAYRMGRDPDLLCTECGVRENGYGKDLGLCLSCEIEQKEKNN